MSVRRESSEKKIKITASSTNICSFGRLKVGKHLVIAVLGGAVPTYGFIFSVPDESVYCFNIAICF